MKIGETSPFSKSVRKHTIERIACNRFGVIASMVICGKSELAPSRWDL